MTNRACHGSGPSRVSPCGREAISSVRDLLIAVSMPYRRRMTLVDVPAFGAWSLLSLTTTAHGAPVYPDELGVRYVYDTAVPNGRYIVPGDLAVVRDNRIVFGAGWIDSIEAAPGRKIRYRCPKCTSTL